MRRKWIGKERPFNPGNNDGSIFWIESSRAEFAIGKVIQPQPVPAMILTEVDTGERGRDLVTWSRRVDVDAESTNVGARFIFIAMQKKAGMGHAQDGIGAGGIVDAPTRRQVRASHGADALNR